MIKPGILKRRSSWASCLVSGGSREMPSVDMDPERREAEAEAEAMEHPGPAHKHRPLTRFRWYRGFRGREFDVIDALAIAVLIITLLLIALGLAGVL